MLKRFKKAKTKTKKLTTLIALTTCVALAVPSVAFAADDGLNNPTNAKGAIVQSNVAQSINSSNYYTWTGKDGVARTDSDIKKRVIKGSSGDWGYIWNRGDGNPAYVPTEGMPTTWDGLGANVNGWWKIDSGWVTFANNNVDYGLDVDSQTARNGGFAPLLPIWSTVLNNTSHNLWLSYSGSKVQISDNNTVLQNNNGWWYIKDGAVDFTFDGLAANGNGAWYCDDGAVDFTKTAIVTDSNGNLSSDKSAEYYVLAGKVQEGLGEDIVNVNGTWYHMENGEVLHQETVAENINGWFYCNSQGRVDFTYNGIAYNGHTGGGAGNGWWYIAGGKVDFNYTGPVSVYPDTHRSDQGSGTQVTYQVVNGAVQ